MKLSKIQKMKLSKWIKGAQQKLLLNHWSIRIFYDEKISSLMEVRCDAQYLRASICVDEYRVLQEWKKHGDEVMQKHAFHEVVHVLLNRMDYAGQARWCTDSEWKEVNESTTEHITSILCSER